MIVDIKWMVFGSLSGQLLGKIPRPVRVIAEGDRGVECEPLERHDAEKRRKRLT